MQDDMNLHTNTQTHRLDSGIYAQLNYVFFCGQIELTKESKSHYTIQSVYGCVCILSIVFFLLCVNYQHKETLPYVQSHILHHQWLNPEAM